MTEHWQKISASQGGYSQDPDFVADVRLGDLGQQSEISQDLAATEREMRNGIVKSGQLDMDDENVSMEFDGAGDAASSKKSTRKDPNVFGKTNRSRGSGTKSSRTNPK